jgi:hypothetical protein
MEPVHGSTPRSTSPPVDSAVVSLPRDLRADTTLTTDPDRAGRYHADIPEDWKVVYTFGGVSMYTALRAMQEALDRPEMPLVTANAIFLAPVPPGPLEIDVDVLRDGRNASQVAADVHVPGAGPALRVHGVFGRAHDTHLAFQDVVVPEVPLPHQIDPPPLPDRPNPFGRIPLPRPDRMASGQSAGRARTWPVRLVGPARARTASLRWFARPAAPRRAR